MRFGFYLAVVICLLLPGPRSAAHPADEFPQVLLQITIDATAVELFVEIPARTATLDVFDGLTPVDMDRMEPEDLADVIAPVFAKRCPLKIDGVQVPPTILAPVVVMSNSRQPARRFPVAQTLEQGTLTFAARYETKAPPRRVSLDWSIYANQYNDDGQAFFADDLLMVAALLVTDQRERFVFFTPLEPGYTWHAEGTAQLPADLLSPAPVQRNFLYLPVPSIVLVLAGLACGAIALRQSRPRGVGLIAFSLIASAVCLPYGRLPIEHTPSHATLDDAEALAVFETVHRNIYRAFDYTDEGAVYDALAQSVAGPMLETIYNDVYQSLIMREENGAVSKVVRVEIDQANLLPASEQTQQTHGRSAFSIHCDWQVDGLVTHFGHTHARTNAFQANYTVAAQGEGWRIVDAQILQQRRIDDGNQSAQDLLSESDEQGG